MSDSEPGTAEPDPLAPRRNPDLIGHEAAERSLIAWAGSGRLPHAIILAGPRGIGKATLAFRFARFLLAGGGVAEAPGLFGATPAPLSLGIDPGHPAARRVAAGGHADLFTLERAWDAKTKRLRQEIVIADVRALSAFLRLTPAEGGWRIVIVDGAESMNRAAMNALLKLLEEPPRQALLLLVSHAPGRLLPTVRSRCRMLPMQPLATAEVVALLARHRPDLDAAERTALAGLADGSIGRALDLADAGGIELHRALVALLGDLPALDGAALHALADRMARGDSDGWTIFEELLLDLIARLGLGAAEGRSRALVESEAALFERLAARAPADRWLALNATLGRLFARGDALNLDRKQMLLDAASRLRQVASGGSARD